MGVNLNVTLTQSSDSAAAPPGRARTESAGAFIELRVAGPPGATDPRAAGGDADAQKRSPKEAPGLVLGHVWAASTHSPRSLCRVRR